MKTKVNALTLNEMVIVMIITSIVVGLAFTVLSLVQRHMWSIQQNFNLNTEFNRLEEALWVDTNNYNTMMFNETENTLMYKTVLDSVEYQFKNGFTVRDKDTFNLQIEHKAIFFNGKKVNNGKIDAIRLELSKKHSNQSIFVFKINDAKQFVD
jgi:type II secretory pathway component PulJ